MTMKVTFTATTTMTIHYDVFLLSSGPIVRAVVINAPWPDGDDDNHGNEDDHGFFFSSVGLTALHLVSVIFTTDSFTKRARSNTGASIGGRL